MKKNRILSALVLSMGLLTFAACEQDEILPDNTDQNQAQEEIITEEEAIEIISKSMAEETEGMDSEAKEAVAGTETYAKSLNCGDSGDTTFVRSHEGPDITASFTIHRSWELLCENGQPVTLQLLREVEGGYETGAVIVEGTAVTALEITHLLSPNFVIANGTRNAQRTRTSTSDPEMALDITMDMTFVDIKIARTPHHQILAGEAVFLLEVVNSNGNSRTFEGSLIFLGNRTGLLTINGHTKIISW